MGFSRVLNTILDLLRSKEQKVANIKTCRNMCEGHRFCPKPLGAKGFVCVEIVTEVVILTMLACPTQTLAIWNVLPSSSV